LSLSSFTDLGTLVGTLTLSSSRADMRSFLKWSFALLLLKGRNLSSQFSIFRIQFLFTFTPFIFLSFSFCSSVRDFDFSTSKERIAFVLLVLACCQPGHQLVFEVMTISFSMILSMAFIIHLPFSRGVLEVREGGVLLSIFLFIN
jgi:hypothetical protein